MREREFTRARVRPGGRLGLAAARALLLRQTATWLLGDVRAAYLGCNSAQLSRSDSSLQPAHARTVLVLSLRGYCFFGTAIRLLEKVKTHLERANAAAAAAAVGGGGGGYHSHHHATHHNHHLFFEGAAPPMSITMNGGTITPPAGASSPLGSPHRASIANGFSVVFNRGGPLSLSPQNSAALRRAAAGAAAAAAAAHRRRRGSSGGSSAGSSYGDLSAAASPVAADGSGGGMWSDHDVARARGGSSGAAPLLTGAAARLSSSTAAAAAASPGSVHTVYGTARTPRDDAAAPLPTLRRSSSARSAAAGGGGGGGARYVVLDMREVPGVDATAARVCFLMLKQLLHASGVTPVFAAVSGCDAVLSVRKPVRNLLTAHKVIDSGDAVFDTLDAALEWCEERLLQAAVRRVFDASGQAAAPPPQPPRSAPLPLPPPLQPPPPPDAAAAAAAAALSLSPEESLMLRDVEYYSHAVAMRASNASERGSLGAVSSSVGGGGGGGIGGRLAQHETDAAAAAAAVAPVMGGEVPGSLCAILEDYLEVDQPQERARNRELLQRCMQYFREEVIPKDTELFNEADGSTKLRFIKAGAVELQMVTLNSDDTAAAGAAARGELHRHRLMKVSAGGTFGEVGFFLRRAQPFRAIALERCIVFTLSRPAMDRMQRESPELCVLVQKAVLKSLCLEASFSIEAQHFAPF
ncbi:hypothetical protein JKP88DRAFT_352139 [Tribonema minus]|uniref:Cyclic nucleotide-binding domain-containing protein n=1 Tax=Tribonema minus TaxID=303371 RepID=A0A835ZNF9_9STRA|nr:hypothetical protein JKP88DRAFT_352139 [Tribonema minus]